MMHRNILGRVIGLVLAGAVLVACGGGAAPASTPAPPTDTPVATATLSAHDHLEQGKAYFEQGKLDEAIAEIKVAIELEPDNAIARHNLGAAYAYQSRWEDAVAAYEKAIELNPNFGEAYGDVTWAYIELDRLPEAVTAGEKAIQLAPQYANGYNNLGMAYSQQGRFTEASALFKRALELDPKAARAWVNLGTIALKQSQYDEAIPLFQKAIQLDPRLAMAYNNLGIAYRALGKSAEAIAAYEAYLRLAPDAQDKAAVEREIAKLKGQPAKGTAAEYRNAQGGYSLRIPKGWAYKESKAMVTLAPSKQALEAFMETALKEGPLLAVDASPQIKLAADLGVKDPATPAAFVQAMTATLDAQMGKIETGRIDGYSTAYANVSGTYKGVPYQGGLIAILVNERVVAAYVLAPPAQWETVRPIFLDMLDRLSFFEP